MTGNGLDKLHVIPFGSQYYRAPTPDRSEWKSDMASMCAAGFNTIKIWAQWRWNNPAEDRFYWDDLDELMDLASGAGLQVVINTILDCAPAWLYRRHPDCVMLRANGERVGPVTLGHRQIGGAPGPCFHHAEAMRAAERFIAAVVERYSSHPALLLWDLWNEPELTVGLLREPRIENLVCYCDNSRRAFVCWLERRYGSIEGLNEAWHRNYGSWNELELPIQPHAFKDMVDWRTFFVDTVTENMEMRARIAREHDKTHPVMCHTVPTPHFNPVTCGSDDWALARCCDLFGNSVGSDPMPADMMRSAARGKTVINAEIHAIPGSTFFRPAPAGFEEMKRHLLVPLAHGIKGFLFWQYRPELLGAESPAWGLTFPDGRPAPWLADVSRIGNAIVTESAFFLNAERAKPQVALFTSPDNQVFCWAASGAARTLDHSLAGAYRALHRANYSIDFLHPSDILSGVLEDHRVLYMPLPYWVDGEVLERIKLWVQAGGHLISECFIGAFDTASGLYSRVLPGMGLHELFEVAEGMVYPECGVFDSYSSRTEGAGRGIRFSLTCDIGGVPAGAEVPGFGVGVSLSPCSADVIARFPSGEPAMTTASFGAGTATLVGTMLGAAYSETGDARCADLMAGLVARHAADPIARVVPESSARVDVLSGDGKRWIMLQSLVGEETEVAVELPVAPRRAVVEMFTGERAQIKGGRIRTTLLPGQIKAFWDAG